MRVRIGQILVADGVVTEDAVVRALEYQELSTEPFRLGSILLGWDLLAEAALLAGLEKLHRCPSVTWEQLSLASFEAVRAFPREKALKLGALPYDMQPGRLRMAFRDPSNLVAVDEASQIAGKAVVPLVTTEVALAFAHKKFYAHPIPNQLRPIGQKLGRRSPAPGVGIPITRPAEAVPVAARETSSQPDWPFWTPDEPAESAPPEPMDGRFSWMREARPAPDEERRGRLDLEAGEARNRDQIAAPVIETLLAEFPRVVVFGVGKAEIAGWAGRGGGLSRESVSSIRVPARGSNVLAEVASTGVPHFGPVHEEHYPRSLGPAGSERACAVFPIRVLDSVAGLLYADRMGSPMPLEDFALVARGAASAASLLSKFLLTEESGTA